MFISAAWTIGPSSQPVTFAFVFVFAVGPPLPALISRLCCMTLLYYDTAHLAQFIRRTQPAANSKTRRDPGYGSATNRRAQTTIMTLAMRRKGR